MQIPLDINYIFPVGCHYMVSFLSCETGVFTVEFQNDNTDKTTSLQLISSKMKNSKDVNLDEYITMFLLYLL